MTAIKQALREFILQTALPGESPENLRDTTLLQSSGILDSLAVLGLATFIKERFNVELDVYETGVEQFDRIDDIATLIVRKRAAPDETIAAPHAG